jgi:hypothetical protein
MKLPDYPVAGEPMRASWGRQVIDYLRSITPRAGLDVYPEVSANGTTYRSVAPGGANRTTASFPWDKLLFGYSIDGNVFTVKAGQIHFRDKIYAVAETELTIAADLTYVYVEMEWGTGISSLKQTTTIANATASSSCFRKWLYLLNYTAPASVSVKTYGHTGGAISIMPVFG